MYTALCDRAVASLLLSSRGHGGLVFSPASDAKAAGGGGEADVFGTLMPITGR